MDSEKKVMRHKGRFIKRHMLLKKRISEGVGKDNVKKKTAGSENEPPIKIKQEEPEPNSYEFVACEGDMSQINIKEEKFETENSEIVKNEHSQIDIKDEGIEAHSSEFAKSQKITQTNIKLEEPEPHMSKQQTPPLDGVVIGNRIVDLSFLAEALECAVCKELLHLKDIEKETRRGLGSFLYVRCLNCCSVTRVTTSEYSENEDSKREHFEINSKVALGCIQTDISNSKLNKLLTCLGIPPVTRHTQQFYEKKVRSTMESTATSSRDEATTDENAEAASD